MLIKLLAGSILRVTVNTFQTIILGIFGFFVLAGLLTIALTRARGSENVITVTLWGAAPSAEMSKLSERFFPSGSSPQLAYRQVAADELDRELLEGLASGRGPDAVLLPAELLPRWTDKLYLIPYSVYSERGFKDSFIQEGDLFLLPGGIAALPVSVDPLVMYWNRNLFDAGGVAKPPEFWDEFLLLGSRITERDRQGNIARSAVALGEYRNIKSAREILAAMFLQAGNQIVAKDASGYLRTVLRVGQGAESVLNFYTEFANPAKPTYSWNRAMPDSRSAFLGGRAAVYFGFGSERKQLRSGNPNLNFDVARFPRPRAAEAPLTYGRLTGVAVLKAARNPSAALQAALTLSSSDALQAWSAESGLPPVRRELLSVRPTDAFGAVLYDSALRSRGFFDPDPARSGAVFEDMIQSVTSGKAGVGQALSDADAKLSALLRE